MTRFVKFLWLLVIIGLVVSAGILSQRMSVESQNKSAEMVLDYAAVCDYSRVQGIPLDTLLSSYRKLGVTSLALQEDNRDDLLMRGLARCLNSFEIQDLQSSGRVPYGKTNPSCAYFAADSVNTAQRIYDGAVLSLGKQRVQFWPDKSSKIVEIKADLRSLSSLGLGFSPEIVKELVGKYGYRLWLRPWNYPDLSAESVTAKIDSIKKLPGCEGVIFAGIRNEVLGYPDQLELVSNLLEDSNLKIGVIELAPQVQQKGIQTLAKNLPDKVVRVMALSGAHQSKLYPEMAVSMYSLGVRERNIRLVYVRPYYDGVGTISLTDANNQFFDGLLNDSLLNFQPYASTFTKHITVNNGFSLWTLAYIALTLSVSAGLCLLVHRVVFLPHRFYKLFLILTIVGAVGVLVTGIMAKQWRMVWALGAVTVFPVLGLTILLPNLERPWHTHNFANVILEGWKYLAFAAAFSLIGGLTAAAFLPDVYFMLGLDVFRGVKIHSILVPLTVMMILLVRMQRQGGLKSLFKLLNRNVKVWHVLVFSFLCAACLFYLIRTGNAGGDIVVSEGERAFRRWLDAFLGIRPRFKEFLLGNPCLIILPVLAFFRWKGLIPFALLAACVGQAALSDTYAHIHTPLAVSLIRTLYGVVLGGLLGTMGSIFLYLLKKFFFVRWEEPVTMEHEVVS